MSDGFVEFNNAVVVGWMDGCEQPGDEILVCDVLGVSRKRGIGSGLDGFPKGNDPISVRPYITVTIKPLVGLGEVPKQYQIDSDW